MSNMECFIWNDRDFLRWGELMRLFLMARKLFLIKLDWSPKMQSKINFNYVTLPFWVQILNKTSHRFAIFGSHDD